jgi:hypothetical protein
LPCYLGNRNVEDIQVLFADQVEQQVQRPFEGLEKYLQCVRRYIEIGGEFFEGLAPNDSDASGYRAVLRRSDFRSCIILVVTVTIMTERRPLPSAGFYPISSRNASFSRRLYQV